MEEGQPHNNGAMETMRAARPQLSRITCRQGEGYDVVTEETRCIGLHSFTARCMFGAVVATYLSRAALCLHRQQQIVEGQLHAGPANNPHQSESGQLAISARCGKRLQSGSRTSDDLRYASSIHLCASNLRVLACLSPRCLAMGMDDVGGPCVWRGHSSEGQHPEPQRGIHGKRMDNSHHRDAHPKGRSCRPTSPGARLPHCRALALTW
jgi:hypothetical protein